jgi:phage terminase small subunit
MAVKMSEIPEDLRDLFDEKRPGRNVVKATSVRKGTVQKMALPRDTDMFLLDNGLTPTQEAYARARAFGMTQQEAMYFATNGRVKAVGAGSSMESEYPLVRKRINELAVEVAQRVVESAAASKAWVMKRLMQVADRCMAAEPVLMFNRQTGEYEETGEYKFDSAGANRSLELIGKELGMFQTRINVKTDQVAELTEAQLREVAMQLANEIGVLTLDA